MLRSAVAELEKVARRRVNWFLLGIALLLGLTFTYLIPLAGASGVSGAPGSNRGLASTAPEHLVGNALGGLPVFLGSILVVIGVLVVGVEYDWGTWKTVLTQGPSRWRVYGGKVAALAVASLVVVVAVFAMSAVAGGVIASANDLPQAWPGVGEVLRGVGAGWLIAMTWAMFGGALAVVLRGVALPIGLGLVWLLVVQNLLFGLAAPLLAWVDALRRALPGANAGSLVAALGGANGPGVAALDSGTQATVVLVAYLVLFTAVGGILLSRRDV